MLAARQHLVVRDRLASADTGREAAACRAEMPASQASSLIRMRAVQTTRFGGPEVMDVVDLPDPVPGPGQHDVSTAGLNFADTHHHLSRNLRVTGH